ncbi:MAG: HPr family phosphocarrier protein [Ectobacillus sp.]
MRILATVLEKDLTLEQRQAVVKLLSNYEADALLTVREKVINMKSILGLCSLVLEQGDSIEVRTFGYDEDEALQAVKEFLHPQHT